MVIDWGGASFLAAALIRKHEGLRLAPYFCPAGKLTVGYGHVILKHEAHLRAGVTDVEAEALLLRDLAWALYAARSVGRVLTDGQAAALASLVFNIGAEAWATSTIRGMVMAGDMAGAAKQFERWNKSGGVVLQGLVNRRADEKRIFEGGSWIG
jgi:lysozyme